MKRAGYLKNAAVLTVGGFAAKAIGALYRIPLMGLIGGYGMGLYQMAYPLFCVLLTFSSTGIPSAFSRLIAQETARGTEDGGTVRAALSLFALLGLTGTLVMCLLSPLMSALQGEDALEACYFALAPSVLLCALIAVFRGYFQGKNRMEPTASSEIVEQLVKTAVGLACACFFRGVQAVIFALFAVTASELAALVYLWARYRGERRVCLPVRRPPAPILPAVLPVMAATSLLPLSQTLDSVLVVRLLSRHTARAVALYGIFSGGVLALVNLPATLSYGLAAAIVPAVASARGEEGRRRAMFALLATVCLSLPCAVVLYAFAAPISAALYPSLGDDAALLASLLRMSAVSAVTLSCVDTLAACLTGMGRAKYAAAGMAAAVAVKATLQLLLVGNPRFSIYGAAIAANVCYPVAFFFDLVYTVKKPKERHYDHSCKSRDGARRLDRAGRAGGAGGGRDARAHRRNSLGADA